MPSAATRPSIRTTAARSMVKVTPRSAAGFKVLPRWSSRRKAARRAKPEQQRRPSCASSARSSSVAALFRLGGSDAGPPVIQRRPTHFIHDAPAPREPSRFPWLLPSRPSAGPRRARGRSCFPTSLTPASRQSLPRPPRQRAPGAANLSTKTLWAQLFLSTLATSQQTVAPTTPIIPGTRPATRRLRMSRTLTMRDAVTATQTATMTRRLGMIVRASTTWNTVPLSGPAKRAEPLAKPKRRQATLPPRMPPPPPSPCRRSLSAAG